MTVQKLWIQVCDVICWNNKFNRYSHGRLLLHAEGTTVWLAEYYNWILERTFFVVISVRKYIYVVLNFHFVHSVFNLCWTSLLAAFIYDHKNAILVCIVTIQNLTVKRCYYICLNVYVLKWIGFPFKAEIDMNGHTTAKS